MQINDSNGENMGFGIAPKTNCPHFKSEWGDKLLQSMNTHKSNFCKQPCIECQNTGENWVCLQCTDIFCSRYVKEHMVLHNEQSKHPIALSFLDGSFWCYSCDSYITNLQMDKLRQVFAKVKFDSEESLEKQFKGMKINDDKEKDLIEKSKQSGNEKEGEEEEKKEEEKEEQEIKFTENDLIDGLKAKKFKKVAFLTGAGISVAAGIPDFRTPGTGLYSQLEKYNLPFPEAVFELNFFKKNPKPFYTLAKEFLASGMQPTISHNLIAQFEKDNILKINLSQNIDGLEFVAGVKEDHLVQAHGHFRTAHCIGPKCLKNYPMEQFNKSVEKEEFLTCDKCESYVKPDIVFFGEQLPNDFFKGIQKLQECDLVFVMGTSLKVQPFASLVDVISEKVPLVLMNMENPGICRENFLFIEGDLEKSSSRILEKWGKEVPKIEKKEIIVDKNKAFL